MANFLEQMESNIFDAQITRLARKTGKTPDKEFMRAMYYRVKERYKEELQKRKIVLRQLDAVRLDEIVSYVFYYHLFHTAHLPQPLVAQLEGDENYRGFLVRDVAVYMVINEHLNVEKLSNTSEYSPRSPRTTWRAVIRSSCSVRSAAKTGA